MKKCFLPILLFALLTSAYGQQAGNELPPYKKNPTLPPLELQMPDYKMLVNASIAQLPTLIIYFSPTCDHCIDQMKEMRLHMDQLKKVQVIMATYQPMEELKLFIEQYSLKKYPFIRLGRDVKYRLPPFYKMASMPYLALYNANGKLITTFEGTTKMDRIFKAFGMKTIPPSK